MVSTDIISIMVTCGGVRLEVQRIRFVWNHVLVVVERLRKRSGGWSGSRSGTILVMCLAIWFAILDIIRRCVEPDMAHGAAKAIAMPLALQCADKITLDRVLTPCALGSEKTEIVFFAVWEPVVDHVSVLLKRVAAVSTEKVAWMPALTQCRQTFVLDRGVAVAALGAELVMVIEMTIRLAILVEELDVLQVEITD